VDEQKRLLLALALIGLTVFAMTTFWPMPSGQQPGQQVAQQTQTAPVATEDLDSVADQAETPERPTQAEETAARQLNPEQRVALRSPKLAVEFTSRGGGLVEAILLEEQFKEEHNGQDRQIDLVSANVAEQPEQTPLAFQLVERQPYAPRSSQSPEGLGVLQLVNAGASSAAGLEALTGVGSEVASRLYGRRPLMSLAEIRDAIGGTSARTGQVLGKLVGAAWQAGYIRLDFEVVRADDEEIVLRGRTDHGLEVVRTIRLAGDYEVELRDELKNRGERRLHLRERLRATGVERDRGSSGWFQRPEGQLQGLCYAGEDMVRRTRGQLAGESQGCSGGMGCGTGESGADSRSGPIRFVAVDRHFFMTASAPSPAWGEATCTLQATTDRRLEVTLEPVMFTELPPGSQTSYVSTTYLGPKKYSLLRGLGAGRRLWEAIDYGWFAALSHVLLKALQIFYNWVGNWGVSIILLTFLIKLLLLPVTQKTLKSMRQMQAEMAQLKPQMDEINERYKDQPDVKQQKLMELYSQNGINPLKQLSGCMPMLLQMPIWIALYRMISESVELYRAPFFGWLDDLSAQDPYYILPALLGLSMFVQQAVTPQPGMDNAQAKMMKWMMPGMFLLIMLNMPAGLVLYIFANTLLTIVQQQFINRQIPADGPGGTVGGPRSNGASKAGGGERAARGGARQRRKRK
jgi:YidC/Oxa1 family membrane protein insertase